MAAARGGECGGIAKLLELIEGHTSAFEYDWRTRFGMPLRAVFDGTMTWRETAALVRELLQDPSSRVCAAVSGWPEPWPREAFILADLFDLTHSASSRRQPKPYPRPMDRPRRSARPAASQRAILAALEARGHTMN